VIAFLSKYNTDFSESYFTGSDLPSLDLALLREPSIAKYGWPLIVSTMYGWEDVDLGGMPESMIEETAFKRLIFRAALRHVHPR
jgi:hypothetical protein